MTTARKAGILVLSTAMGIFIGLPVYIFASFCLLLWYGDNGHPAKLLTVLLFYGVFGTTALMGFGAGIFICDRGYISGGSAPQVSRTSR